tara:strand:- start:20 stop:190 length:171 start_codon:yes stop_codon:yes gene_type:complete
MIISRKLIKLKFKKYKFSGLLNFGSQLDEIKSIKHISGIKIIKQLIPEAAEILNSS